jgi:hypothetical protein
VSARGCSPRPGVCAERLRCTLAAAFGGVIRKAETALQGVDFQDSFFIMAYRLLALLTALCLGIASLPALAQVQRQFPADALRGALVVGNPPEVTVNGQPARLAPGARIRGANNMVALSGSLIGQRLLVHYTVDIGGHVKDVWILTPEEASRKPWPATPEEAERWTFDAAAQVWTRK